MACKHHLHLRHRFIYIEAINGIYDSSASTTSFEVVANTTHNETAKTGLTATISSAASDHIDWIGLFTSIGVVVIAIGESYTPPALRIDSATVCAPRVPEAAAPHLHAKF